jgi:hypothetical protein
VKLLGALEGRNPFHKAIKLGAQKQFVISGGIKKGLNQSSPGEKIHLLPMIIAKKLQLPIRIKAIKKIPTRKKELKQQLNNRHERLG